MIVILVVGFYHGSMYGQSSSSGNARDNAAWFLGWNGTGTAGTGALNIKNDFNQPIDFWTNTNHHATLDANGNLGIGLTNTNNSFRIANVPVLWHNGITSNMYVGVGAGNTGATGTGNSFFGFSAGNSSTTGSDNTFVGNSAGYSNTSGIQNTFIGYNAGYTGQGAQYSTFVGYYAGYYATGRWNTFTGYYAGWYNTTGEHNCFYGKKSGQHNRVGEGNTFYGDHSGWRVGENYGSSGQYGNYNVFMGDATGNNFFGGDSNVIIGTHGGSAIGNGTNHHGNIFIGAYAGQTTTGHDNILIGVNANSNTNVKNAIAIGATANVTVNNQMILGDNSIQVGIGLSGNAVTGSNTKLEINAPIADWSGLRFRQLTSASSTVSNPGDGVLSVNANGDVIYVPDNGGGGNVSACGTPSTDYLTKWSPSPNDICNSIVFEDMASRIGVSTITPRAKLEAFNNALTAPTYYYNTDVGMGLLGITDFTTNSVTNVGAWGQSSGSDVTNIGVMGCLDYVNTTSVNIGVFGIGRGSAFQNVGGAFAADQCSFLNIGVQG